jgi:hypothetical protein
MIVFISGRLAMTRGLVGSWMSMIDTVSLTGRMVDGLAGLVKRDLLVIAGDQELRFGGRREQGAGSREQPQKRQERLHGLLLFSREFAARVPRN